MAPPTRLLLLPLIFCSVAPLVAQDILPPTSLAQLATATDLKPLNPDGIVQLKTIAGDFATNQVDAMMKYAGQIVTVIGRIANLSQGEGENTVLVVTLQDSSASLPAVKEEFPPGSIPKNSEIEISQDGSTATLVQRDDKGKILSRNVYLTVDQTVSIVGSYKELKAGNIIFTGCSLISKEKQHRPHKK